MKCGAQFVVEWKGNKQEWPDFNWYCKKCWIPRDFKSTDTTSSCCCSESDTFYPVKKPDWNEIRLHAIDDGDLFDTHVHLEGLMEKDCFSNDVNMFLQEIAPGGKYGPPIGSRSVVIITSACDEASIEPTKRLFEELSDVES